MSLKLVHKLLLALFFTTAATLVLMVLIARAGIDRGFRDYIEQQETAWLGNLAVSLADWYETNGDWQRLQGNPRQFARLVRANGPMELQSTPEAPPPAVMQERRERLAQPRPGANPPLPRVALLDADKRPVIGAPLRQLDEDKLVPIQVSGETVGWVGRARAARSPAPQETAFLKRQGRFLLLGFSAALVLAGLMAWWLSRQLGRPVTRVAEGIRALAAGRYDVEVERRGGDEIDALGQDVNRLARKLTQNEQARQRWMADIAHELRTPLAIMRGELDAVREGIRQLGPDTVASLEGEVQQLSRLVDDLRELALSDTGALAYRMEPLDLAPLVQDAVKGLQPRAEDRGLELTASVEPAQLRGDEQRLRQLLGNLLENALRYTEAPGRVRVSLRRDGDQLQLQVDDSAPGVPPEQCERIFERLYRVESSRNRGTGGSGLGLAISRNIVEAHEGTITAQPSELGGLTVLVTLPGSQPS